jgi:hypothetical protein
MRTPAPTQAPRTDQFEERRHADQTALDATASTGSDALPRRCPSRAYGIAESALLRAVPIRCVTAR